MGALSIDRGWRGGGADASANLNACGVADPDAVLAAFAGAQRAKLLSKFELAERLTVNVLLEKARTAKDGGKKLYKGGDADLLPALRKLAGWDGADCAQPICTGNCSAHGECLRDGSCLCEPGFGGADCSVRSGFWAAGIQTTRDAPMAWPAN